MILLDYLDKYIYHKDSKDNTYGSVIFFFFLVIKNKNGTKVFYLTVILKVKVYG